MSTSLILDSLEIKNFRTFRHLQIERLGRVNLIVGKNNVGKTSLLEALRLYSRSGDPRLFWTILAERDEGPSPSLINKKNNVEDRIVAIKYLFHGRQDLQERSADIQIGPINSPERQLLIRFAWFVEQTNPEGYQHYKVISATDEVDNPIPGFTLQLGDQTPNFYRIDGGLEFSLQFIREVKGIKYLFIPAIGLPNTDIDRLWDNITLTLLEAEVLTALQTIAPEVERVGLIGHSENGNERIPIVKIKDFNEPIPLRSLGEGMNRIFGIALALVNAKDGLLLIDEIDSGLHYSVQPDMWRLVFEVARRLNVQVFATTHSWDCLEAFQQAAHDDAQEDGLLISLRRKKSNQDEIVAVLIDEEKLEVVTQERIEVR